MMSETQRRILAVLTDDFVSPTEIGHRAKVDNSGGTAASLHVLVRRRDAERRVIGRKGRWELYGYRRTQRCHSGRDGECYWPACPQEQEGEPAKSGRHCPFDTEDDEP